MSTPVKGYFVMDRQQELRRRFGRRAIPHDGETVPSFFGARDRVRKPMLPDQEWCRTGGSEPPWFGVSVIDPETGRRVVRPFWAGINPAAREVSVYADPGWKTRVVLAASWREAVAALAAVHGVPPAAVETRHSLAPWVRR